MSTPPVLQLPLDLTGNALTNKVSAELHPIAATGTRAFVTTRGPFFSRSLIVRNKATGNELVPDVDYRPVHMFLEASLRTGDEICSVILILPTTNTTEVEVDYQAIGGEYSVSVSAIEQMLEGLNLDNRTIYWGDLLGVPEYFPPTAHLHDIGDLYGFEYVVAALEQIRRAILLGDQAAFNELRSYVNTQDTLLRGLIDSIDSLMSEHINNTNNPHQTNKGHIGLSLVQNYGIATSQQAIDGIANDLYMTPLRTRDAINAQVGNSLSAHIARTDNPHNTNKAQVGLSNVVNYPIATLEEAVGGEANAYMTSFLTKAAIDAFAVIPLNMHIARTDNPHGTTKAHVGLPLVDNFATANAAQAQEGTATNLFLTPAGARLLINGVVGDQYSGHINNLNNPHQVNKAQVGLPLVQNYGMASQTDAQGGSISAAYMSPLTTKYAIDTFAITPLNAHIARTDNPHGTTKAHVGLPLVENYGIAVQADAESGTSNALYMTPLRTKQAITIQAVNPLTTAINQRVVTNSNASLNSLVIGTSGYFYQDVDTSISLRVAGSKYFQFQAGGSFLINNGRLIAAQGIQPSDRRFKKHIRAKNARALWRDIDYKSWTNKQTGHSETGVIAQELQLVAPDRVAEFDHGLKRPVKRLGVDYTGTAFEMAYAAGRMVDDVLELVRKQDELIQGLMKRIAVLEKKI